MVFFSEQQASLFESLTVEGVCVLEYLADALNGDVLGEDLLTPLLERWHIESVSQLKNTKTRLGCDESSTKVC